tara:strand:- start:8311 stop:8610 length:300 start_codon:yes stop_codon:yes gene_type:complete
MNRGQFTNKHIKDGKMRYNQTLLSTIPKNPNDIYVITVVGDRLDLISNTYYGSPNFWWIIAAANNVGLGTTAVAGGIQLRIPAETGALATLMERLQQRG